MRTPLKKHAAAWVCYLLLGAVASVVVAWVVVATRWGARCPTEVGMARIEGMHIVVWVKHASTRTVFEARSFNDESTADEELRFYFRYPMSVKNHAEMLHSLPGGLESALRQRRSQLSTTRKTVQPYLMMEQFGWPARCVMVEAANNGVGPWPPPRRGELKVGSYGPFPYLPLWPGLALNALFYSPVFFGLHEAWRWCMRHLRRSNGLCTRCAYDRRGLTPTAPCPECGHTPRATAAAGH